MQGIHRWGLGNLLWKVCLHGAGDVDHVTAGSNTAEWVSIAVDSLACIACMCLYDCVYRGAPAAGRLTMCFCCMVKVMDSKNWCVLRTPLQDTSCSLTVLVLDLG